MPIFGACYSPYRRSDRLPPYPVSQADVEADMDIIAKRGITHIRTYSQGDAGDGNWTVVRAAAKRGIKVALGVWIDQNPNVTQTRIAEAWGQASLHPGTVVQLVVGNEVNRDDDKHYTPQMVASAMNLARTMRDSSTKIPKDIPITTCFSGTVLTDQPDIWRDVVRACETCVFLTVYPYYAPERTPDNIEPQMRWSWENGLSQVAAMGKAVVIAEIGWPSEGGRDTSVANEATNYAATKAWMSGRNYLGKSFDAYWFEMFDEPWKTQEGSQGPHWGLNDRNGNPKFTI
jgi:exo-beta-1,3-glucanase (GH17 family)